MGSTTGRFLTAAPYCVFAHEAVRLLRASGRIARRLAGGMPEWRLACPSPAGGSPQPASN